MTDQILGRCVECTGDIKYCGGGSWVHTKRINGRNHPASPDAASRASVQEAAA